MKEDWKGKRCVVTGGAGFIGGHLAETLLRRGAEVTILDNLSTGQRHTVHALEATGGDLTFVEGDLRDADVCHRVTRGAEFVFHLAALPSVSRSVEFPSASNAVNVDGTLALLIAARDANVGRFIYSGSSSAYGRLVARGLEGGCEDAMPAADENLPACPLSPYATSKLAAEFYVRNFASLYDIETVSLRYFNVFGPRQSPDSAYAAAVPKFISRMLTGQSPLVYGDGRQSRDFTYVDNAVHANLLAAMTPSDEVTGGVFNVGCGDSTSLLDLIERLNAILGTRLRPEFGPPRPGDVRFSRADISKARRLLGYEVQVTLDEGLKRTVAALDRPIP